MAGNIPFVQYLRPNGRKVLVAIERPDNIAAAADIILAAGFRFEIEQVGDSMVSMTVSDNDGDYACEICVNGPAVPAHVDKLIIGFDLANAIKQRSLNT